MSGKFKRGDIVNVSLNPAIGHEQMGYRPALVLTPTVFNQLGDVLVAPITQGGRHSREAGFVVSLAGSGCKTQGFILINKIRMLDLEARNARIIETVPPEIIGDVIERLIVLLEGSADEAF